MVKKSTKKKATKTVPRITIKTMNQKMLGNEIKFKHKDLTNGDCTDAFNWYSRSLDVSHAREFTYDFLMNNKLEKLAKDSKIISDSFFPKTSGWVFRLVSLGYNLDTEMIKRSILRIKEEIEKINARNSNKNEDKLIVKKPKKSLIADIEDILDSNTRNEITEPNLYNKLFSEKFTAEECKGAIEYYTPIFDEMLSALKPKSDKQLSEGYLKIGKNNLIKRLEFYKKIIDDLNSFINNKKVVVKPRNKKPITLEKKLKNFKYQKQSLEMKIISQNPEKVIDSNEVYVYNSKNTVLTRYVSKENETLDILNNKFINWDETKSSSKRLGKNANTVLQKIIPKAKIPFKKDYEEIKGSSYTVSGRSNEYSIIIKIL